MEISFISEVQQYNLKNDISLILCYYFTFAILFVRCLRYYSKRIILSTRSISVVHLLNLFLFTFDLLNGLSIIFNL